MRERIKVLASLFVCAYTCANGNEAAGDDDMADIATLEALGFSKEEVFQRVVDTIVRDLTKQSYSDEDGDHSYYGESEFSEGIRKAALERIDAEVAKTASEFVEPRIGDILTNLTFQKTNGWGEAKTEPLTLREFLVERASAYMTEEVDSDGKTRKESSSSFWSKKGTRAAHMVDKYLHYHIDEQMKKAFGDLNSQVAKGLNAAVCDSISGILAKLKVTTTIR